MYVLYFPGYDNHFLLTNKKQILEIKLRVYMAHIQLS